MEVAVGELKCKVVVVRETCGLRDLRSACALQCVVVAVYRNCGLWELRWMEVAVWESCGVRELRCGGVSVRGGHGGCQSLIHCVFGFFFLFRILCVFGKKKKKIVFSLLQLNC